MALVFGPRKKIAEAPRRSPLVFGSDLPPAADPSVSQAPARRRYDPDWSLLRAGRCPYCGARLRVRVVAYKPVFFTLEDFDPDAPDSIGLAEVRDYDPVELRAECPHCHRVYEVRRDNRGVPDDLFPALLQFSDWYREKQLNKNDKKLTAELSK